MEARILKLLDASENGANLKQRTCRELIKMAMAAASLAKTKDPPHVEMETIKNQTWKAESASNFKVTKHENCNCNWMMDAFFLDL